MLAAIGMRLVILDVFDEQKRALAPCHHLVYNGSASLPGMGKLKHWCRGYNSFTKKHLWVAFNTMVSLEYTFEQVLVR